jgi:hypothetical protein
LLVRDTDHHSIYTEKLDEAEKRMIHNGEDSDVLPACGVRNRRPTGRTVETPDALLYNLCSLYDYYGYRSVRYCINLRRDFLWELYKFSRIKVEPICNLCSHNPDVN